MKNKTYNFERGFPKSLILSACLLSAIGALVFNAFPVFLSILAENYQLTDEKMGLLGSTYLDGFAWLSFSAVFRSGSSAVMECYDLDERRRSLNLKGLVRFIAGRGLAVKSVFEV